MLISKQCYGKFCIANVRLCQYFEYNDNFCYYTNTVLLSPHCAGCGCCCGHWLGPTNGRLLRVVTLLGQRTRPAPPRPVSAIGATPADQLRTRCLAIRTSVYNDIYSIQIRHFYRPFTLLKVFM